jgi:hypothetical protein
MKSRAVAWVVVLIVVVLGTCFPALAVAQPFPSLVTDQALYTVRDTEVVLRGTGYNANASKPYVVWVQTPTDSCTYSTNVTFMPTSEGDIPPAIDLPIEPDSQLGTYLISISNSTKLDTAIARAHYGIWGTDKFVYQRTEVIQAMGGGLLPKTALTVAIRDPTGNEAYMATVAANEAGAFLTTWKIPPNAPSEEYTVLIDGTGTYDSPTAEFVSQSKFSVTAAFLNITVLKQPSGSYERTQTVSADFVVRYPDSTAVVSAEEGLKPVALYAGRFKTADLVLSAYGNATGIWTAQLKIPKNANLNVVYKFVLPADAFDDGNGNIGPEKDLETDSFNVVPATLRMNVALNSTHYQVPFDTVTAYAKVSYPDGTPVTNATVSAWLSTANLKMNGTVTYDKDFAVWTARYAFGFGDLFKPGPWTLSVNATDVYGNVGAASAEFSAELYTCLEMVIAAVVAVLITRWLVSRFRRRSYLGTKRVLMVEKDHLKAPSLGCYVPRH